MTVGDEAPDKVRADPTRRAGDECRSAVGLAVSDA